jgi:hypothetical protein
MAIDDILALVPQSLVVGFAAIGALYLGGKVFSYIGLLLDLFVLRGTNVRLQSVSSHNYISDVHSSANMDLRALGQL